METKLKEVWAKIDSINIRLRIVRDNSEWLHLMRQRNSLYDDAVLCLRKIDNLRQGRKAHGEPEYGNVAGGKASKVPFMD